MSLKNIFIVNINIKPGFYADGLEIYEVKSTQITAQGLRKKEATLISKSDTFIKLSATGVKR